MSPANGANGVEPGTSISITFSEALNPATVNTGNIGLADDFGAVAGGVSYSADTQTVTFTPTNPLALRRRYRLNVAQGVTSDHGINLEHAFNSFFDTRDGGWSGEMNVGNGEPSTGETGPQVAMNSKGDLIVVWFKNEGGERSVFASQRNAQGSWTTQQHVEYIDRPRSGGLAAGIDEDGNALVVFSLATADYPYRYKLYANHYLAGQGWSGATPIDNSDATIQEVQLEVQPNGNAVTVWSRDLGLYAKHFNARTNQWGSTLSLATSSTGMSFHLAMNKTGDAEVIWAGGSLRELKAKHYRVGSGWDPTTSTISGGCYNVAWNELNVNISEDSSRTLAVWRGRYWDGTERICSSIYQQGGNWSDLHFLDQESGASSPTRPALAIDPFGNAMAIWASRQSSSETNYAYRELGAGAAQWGAKHWLEAANFHAAAEPHIGFDGSGHAMVLSSKIMLAGGTWRAFAKRRRHGGSWEPTLSFAENIGGAPYHLNLNIAPNGKAIASVTTTSIGDIFALLFE